MASFIIHLRFEGELNDFLAPERRHMDFVYKPGATDTIKHIAESVGVPHTELGEIIADGENVAWSWQPAANARVVFRPRALPISLNSHRFVLDGHLGRLAAFLRMLGFDVWYDRFADDLLLASVASSEQRLLLTRDVALLKRREIEAGYWIRSHKPHDQLIEVTRRFALHSGFTPFKRCMDCNGLLQPVSKQEVVSIVPRYIRETKEDFSRCSACGKVFWRGTHYTRMRTLIAQLTP